jgi:hypothetical protein
VAHGGRRCVQVIDAAFYNPLMTLRLVGTEAAAGKRGFGRIFLLTEVLKQGVVAINKNT